MIITLKIPDVEQVKRQLGLDENGQTQTWLTHNVYRHMRKYMPMQTGAFATGQTVVVGSHKIVTTAPQAYYLYYGKRMVNSKTGKGPMYIKGVGYRWPKGATLVATEDDLNYTKTFNALAGPYWDKRMVAAEGEQIADELKEYIKRFGVVK